MNYVFGPEIFFDYQKLVQMSEWCHNMFGPSSFVFESTYPKEWRGLNRWTKCISNQTLTLSFRDPKDYALFLLKWGNQ